MIQKSYDTSMALLELPYTSEVGEVNASVGCGLLSNATKLIWV